MKWLHTLATAALAIGGLFIPQAQDVISHHPTVTVVLGGIWAVLGHLLPSPVVKQG